MTFLFLKCISIGATTKTVTHLTAKDLSWHTLFSLEVVGEVTCISTRTRFGLSTTMTGILCQQISTTPLTISCQWQSMNSDIHWG